MLKLIAYFFLAITLNVVFFHPIDTVTKSDEDPVNSITEFVVEVCMDIEDVQEGDERESESDFFNLAKLVMTSGCSMIGIQRADYVVHENYRSFITCFFIPQQHRVILSPPPEKRA